VTIRFTRSIAVSEARERVVDDAFNQNDFIIPVFLEVTGTPPPGQGSIVLSDETNQAFGKTSRHLDRIRDAAGRFVVRRR
jgi:hypothetical protein